MQLGVIGAGTWGTALSIVLANNGHKVRLWSKFPEEIEALMESRRHKNLPGAVLPDGIIGYTDLPLLCRESDMLVLAVPSIYVRDISAEMAEFITEKKIIVTVAKGIEEDSLLCMSEIVRQEIPLAEPAVLSGPTHAEEVSRLLPTTIVAGAESEEAARLVQDCFMNESFRVYINTDLKGIEIGAALKNVIALAAGIADGLGYGDNTKAALITRGIAEIARLGTAMGCRAETFAGLSGIGDLIVTCASVHSRNRKAGMLMGQGKSYKEAVAEVGQVVEGVYAAGAALRLSEKYAVSMPIVEKVNEILFRDKPAAEAVRELMLRDKKEEYL